MSASPCLAKKFGAFELPREVLDSLMYEDWSTGLTLDQIAELTGKSSQYVRAALRRAYLLLCRRQEERASKTPEPPRSLEPLFPTGGFTPHSNCPHSPDAFDDPSDPSAFVCMVCHKSSFDHHRKMFALPKTSEEELARRRAAEAGRKIAGLDALSPPKPPRPKRRKHNLVRVKALDLSDLREAIFESHRGSFAA